MVDLGINKVQGIFKIVFLVHLSSIEVTLKIDGTQIDTHDRMFEVDTHSNYLVGTNRVNIAYIFAIDSIKEELNVFPHVFDSGNKKTFPFF